MTCRGQDFLLPLICACALLQMANGLLAFEPTINMLTSWSRHRDIHTRPYASISERIRQEKRSEHPRKLCHSLHHSCSTSCRRALLLFRLHFRVLTCVRLRSSACNCRNLRTSNATSLRFLSQSAQLSVSRGNDEVFSRLTTFVVFRDQDLSPQKQQEIGLYLGDGEIEIHPQVPQVPGVEGVTVRHSAIASWCLALMLQRSSGLLWRLPSERQAFANQAEPRDGTQISFTSVSPF